MAAKQQPAKRPPDKFPFPSFYQPIGAPRRQRAWLWAVVFALYATALFLAIAMPLLLPVETIAPGLTTTVFVVDPPRPPPPPPPPPLPAPKTEAASDTISLDKPCTGRCLVITGWCSRSRTVLEQRGGFLGFGTSDGDLTVLIDPASGFRTEGSLYRSSYWAATLDGCSGTWPEQVRHAMAIEPDLQAYALFPESVGIEIEIALDELEKAGPLRQVRLDFGGPMPAYRLTPSYVAP